MQIPKQYLPVMPYLIINNAKAFVEFMKAVFNAEIQLIVLRMEDIIMHGELKIGEAIIMFADTTEIYKERAAGMFIYIESVDKIYAAAIQYGATSLMVPAKMEYGYTAGFEDAFGNQWWVVEPPVDA